MSRDDLPLVMLTIVFQIVNFADAYRIKSEFLNHVTDLFGQAIFRMVCFFKLTRPANVVECSLVQRGVPLAGCTAVLP